MHRWKQRVWSWVGTAALMTGCMAHGPAPRELVDARQAYQHASASTTVRQERPQDVTDAWRALQEAEREYDKSKDSPRTRSLAYVALRKAQLAEAHASLIVAERQRAVASQELQQLQAAQRQQARAQLDAAQQQLAEARRMRDEASRLAEARRLQAETAQLQSEARRQQEEADRLAQQQREADAQAQRLAQAQAQADRERQAREAAERRADDALASLERAGEVGLREDARGTVLTLSGSVLFASGQSDLLPSARNRLAEVAQALKQSDNRLTIEGHTDSLGSDAYNEDLSLRRAEQVQSFLIAQGVPSGRISVRGMGEDNPVASNSTAEGRANNRRVEIVLQHAPTDEGLGVGGSGRKIDSH
jgi:outer membrane protein OmpA-like peptidoglycan-associated protein